jgi:hypothetical protein
MYLTGNLWPISLFPDESKDENPAKRQKHDHLPPRPGKENANVSFVHGNKIKRGKLILKPW